ncbi:MAG: hypothetical protein OXU20_27930 [Myxococcales bacterium]|nr:hypothetical protein [Myxococcales bacterium]
MLCTVDPHALCNTLLAATSKTLRWEWDDRFGCALAAFGANRAQEARAWVCEATPEEWSSDNIGTAPERVQRLAADIGLRSGQFLFTSEPSSDLMAYVAWWPWGDGKKISIRFAIDGASEAELKGWFSLS